MTSDRMYLLKRLQAATALSKALRVALPALQARDALIEVWKEGYTVEAECLLSESEYAVGIINDDQGYLAMAVDHGVACMRRVIDGYHQMPSKALTGLMAIVLPTAVPKADAAMIDLCMRIGEIVMDRSNPADGSTLRMHTRMSRAKTVLAGLRPDRAKALLNEAALHAKAAVDIGKVCVSPSDVQKLEKEYGEAASRVR